MKEIPTAIPNLVAGLLRTPPPGRHRSCGPARIIKYLAPFATEAVSALGTVTARQDGCYGEAIEALRRFGPAARPAVPALLGALRGSDSGTHLRIVCALQKIDATSAPVRSTLREARTDPDLDARSAAYFALGPTNEFRDCVRVGGAVAAPRLLSVSIPSSLFKDYPKQDSSVSIAYGLYIDEQGVIQRADPLSPLPPDPSWAAFDIYWRREFEFWRFTPTLVTGKPRPVCMSVLKSTRAPGVGPAALCDQE